MRKRKLPFCVFFLFFVLILGPNHAPCQAENLGKNILGKLMNPFPSDWDPVGHYLFDPVEEAMPKLRLRGFLMGRPSLVLHNNPYAGTNLPRAKYDLQTMEWLQELEQHYRFTEHVELTAIEHIYYDAAYDWDHRLRKAFRKFRELEDNDNLEYYKDGDRILRELYLGISYPNWKVRLGKQQVVWGRIDERRIMDFVNPEDFREGFDHFGGDWEFFRRPLWMLNFIYLWGDYNFQFLWIPDFEYNLVPFPGQPWSFNAPPAPPPFVRVNMGREKPDDWDFEDSSFAIRFGFLKGGWDAHFSYAYTWNHNPAAIFRGVSLPAGGIPTPADPIQINLALKHVRHHQIGANIDYDWYLSNFDKHVVIRSELLYTIGDYFTDSSESPFLGENGVKKKDWLAIAAPIVETTIFTDVTVDLAVIHDIVFNYGDDLRDLPVGRRKQEYETTIVPWVMHQSLNDRLTQIVFFAYQPDHGDWTLRGFLTYEFTKKLYGEFAWSIFGGGSSDDIFGQYDKRDNIEFRLKYSF